MSRKSLMEAQKQSKYTKETIQHMSGISKGRFEIIVGHTTHCLAAGLWQNCGNFHVFPQYEKSRPLASGRGLWKKPVVAATHENYKVFSSII